MKIAICGKCPIRRIAEKRPDSWFGRVWRWHTRWCPGWKAYQLELSSKNEGGAAQQSGAST
jgi:hypothetical protein